MKNILLGALLFLLCNPVGVAEDWPGFRGPTRQGISQEKDLPIHWSAIENVAWKIDLPGLGYSSPITSNGRVYVTTATEDGASLRLLCADAASGKVLWRKEIIRQRSGHKQENNSYATPTPVTDAERLYVLTEDGTLLGLTMEGEEVWRHKEFDFFSEHGIAVSPILEEGVLVVAYDGSSGGEDGDVGWRKPWDEALVLAVDAATGAVRWRGRPSRWSRRMNWKARFGRVSPSRTDASFSGRMTHFIPSAAPNKPRKLPKLVPSVVAV